MSLPPVEVPQGAIRFNTDSQKLEFYAQDQWWEMVIDTPNLAVGSNTGAGARGIFGGGAVPGANKTTIDYINISSTGNAIKFGDLSAARRSTSACSSTTRGVFGSGADVPVTGTKIDFITISSTGTATDFGTSFANGKRNAAGCSNATRGIFAGGNNDGSPSIFFNVIDYITIATTGIIVDFGDLTRSVDGPSAFSSSVRGVFTGGASPAASPAVTNVIDYVTISTTGNATDFGDLTQSRRYGGGCSNATRGLSGGGSTPTTVNTIDYVTIASLGNAVAFGNLTSARDLVGSCSSSIRGVWSSNSPGTDDTIDYVTIATQGNAVDFGNLFEARGQTVGCSNAHGGL